MNSRRYLTRSQRTRISACRHSSPSRRRFLGIREQQSRQLTAAYALSPVDLIPDFIPVLGYLDDVILLPALIALTIRAIPKEIWERNRRAAEGMWEDGKPVKWYCAIPIVFLWLWMISAVIRAALA